MERGHRAIISIFSIFEQMIADEIKRKLQDLVYGNVLKGQEDPCTAARNYLCRRFGAGRTVKKEFESKSIVKEEQVALLEAYARETRFSNKSTIPYLPLSHVTTSFLPNASVYTPTKSATYPAPSLKAPSRPFFHLLCSLS